MLLICVLIDPQGFYPEREPFLRALLNAIAGFWRKVRVCSLAMYFPLLYLLLPFVLQCKHAHAQELRQRARIYVPDAKRLFGVPDESKTVGLSVRALVAMGLLFAADPKRT